jgi:hypothetical protein
MEDPFGLLNIDELNKTQDKAKPQHKRTYLVIISVLASLVVLLVIGFLIQFRNNVSADVNVGNYLGTLKLTGLPEEIKTGDSISLTLSVTNQGQTDIRSSYVLVQGYGLNLSNTLNLARNLSESESGFLRQLNSEELLRFENAGDSNFYWYVGDLNKKQTKSQQILAKVTAANGATPKIEAKYFLPQTKTIPCGMLSLGRCQTIVGSSQIGGEQFLINLVASDKIRLRAGYNFITLPYIMTTGSIKDFLSSLKDHWAYVFQPTTGGYVDLNSGDNASLIKPGVGFWIYDSIGGEYALPSTKVETNVNEALTLNLDIGYNQIGNPYPKRIILSGDKILVREIAEDGSATGAIYSLKSAIDSGVLSAPYIISYKSSGGGNTLSDLLEYKALPLNSTLSAYTALTVKSTKKVTLIFPGKEIVAPGDLLSAEEKAKVEKWILDNGLNQFGDPAGTAYSGGTPLIDEKTGQTIDRLDYIVTKHPDRPWNK